MQLKNTKWAKQITLKLYRLSLDKRFKQHKRPTLSIFLVSLAVMTKTETSRPRPRQTPESQDCVEARHS